MPSACFDLARPARPRGSHVMSGERNGPTPSLNATWGLKHAPRPTMRVGVGEMRVLLE